MEKNKDELLLNVREILTASTMPFMKTLFTDSGSGAGGAASGGAGGASGGAGGARDKQSQSLQFRKQLSTLMDVLNATEPHYIRCIKPTNTKKPNVFEAPICLQQLRYAGVFEAVRIRQLGYPFRWTYDMFYRRYRCCAGHPRFRNLIPAGMNWKEGARELVADLSVAAPALDGVLKFGKTMVLYRADPNRILEMMRDYARDNAARVAQRVFRGFRVRKMTKRLFAMRDRMRAAMKARDLGLVTAALQEGAAAKHRLFEMRALEALHKVLLEEKACRETLQALLPFDPVVKYAEYEAALKDASRLGLKEPLVDQVTYKFGTVKDRIETKANLIKGIDMGDKDLILKSLKRAEELKVEWGDIVPPELIAQATETLAIIAKEEATLDELKAVLAAGAAGGSVGALDVSGVETAALEAVLTEALSGRVRINTRVGQNLVLTCQRVRDLRKALKSSEWPAIEAAVATVAAMRADGTLAPQAVDEVKKAEAEVADRRISRTITHALSVGVPRGRVGELHVTPADAAALQAALDTATAQATELGGLSPPATHLLNCAKLIVRLRNALSTGDWPALRKVLLEVCDHRMPEAVAPELAAAKDEVENHEIIRQMAEALEKGFATGTVSKLDASHVDLSLLLRAATHADNIGPKTVKAQQTLKLVKLVRRLRESLQAGDYPAVLETVKQASTVPREYVPHTTADELLLAQYEAENVTIVRTLREAVSSGAARGLVGAVPRSTINTALLTAGIKKAKALIPRSEEALWLLEVSEALLALRNTYRETDWARLNDAILQVRGLDHSRPAARAVEAAPVMKERTRAPAARMSIAPGAMGGILGGSMLADLAGAGRSRTTSSETRDRPVSMRLGGGGGLGGSDGGRPVSGAYSTSASVAGSDTVSDGGGDHDDGGFALPEEVQSELGLLQDELDNYNLITDLTAALSTGAATGPLGMLDTTTLQLGELDMALKRHDRAMVIKTPLAASLLYTARVASDLRHGLQGGDWDKIGATLHIVAANNARVVRFAAASNPELRALERATTIPTSALGQVEVPAFADDPVVIETALFTLHTVGIAEVARVEQEVEYRRVLAQMTASLESGGPFTGPSGLDSSTVTVDALAAAIDASRALGARTEVSKHLTNLCRLTWQMRTAVLEDDWVSGWPGAGAMVSHMSTAHTFVSSCAAERGVAPVRRWRRAGQEHAAAGGCDGATRTVGRDGAVPARGQQPAHRADVGAGGRGGSRHG